HREIVGVGVARPRAGLGPNARPLAHVTGRPFDNVFFEYQLFVDTVLEVDVGVVDAAAEVTAGQALHELGGDVEPVGAEALGSLPSEIFRHREGPRTNRRRRPAPSFSDVLN